MSAVEENEKPPSRLTFRQKFWLFGVALPLFSMIVLFVLAVFLPKPLNPTEKKLVGRWEVVEPPEIAGRIIEYHPGYKDDAGYRFIMWCPDEHTLCMSWFEYGEVPEVWAHFWAKLGRSTSVAEILSLDENELKIKYTSDIWTIVLRRMEAADPELQDSE